VRILSLLLHSVLHESEPSEVTVLTAGCKGDTGSVLVSNDVADVDSSDGRTEELESGRPLREDWKLIVVDLLWLLLACTFSVTVAVTTTAWWRWTPSWRRLIRSLTEDSAAQRYVRG
jgi:hypothetical protein